MSRLAATREYRVMCIYIFDEFLIIIIIKYLLYVCIYILEDISARMKNISAIYDCKYGG